jgi:hypothetical protein
MVTGRLVLLVCCAAIGLGGQVLAQPKQDKPPPTPAKKKAPKKVVNKKSEVEKQREQCRKEIDFSGIYEVVLTSVPHDVSGAQQCKGFETGTKFKAAYGVAHDVAASTAQVANREEEDTIVRDVVVVQAPASDSCAALGETKTKAAGLKWKEYRSMKPGDAIQWTIVGGIDARGAVRVVGIATTKDDRIVCYYYLD